MAADSPSSDQRRFLLYADVLGADEGLSAFSDVVAAIHRYAQAHNERLREEMRKLDGPLIRVENGQVRVQIMPGATEVQFGVFSNRVVVSLPESRGDRVLDIGAQLVIDLLHLDFLVRGAVVLGQLHHRDNIIFGPALLQAREMEQREAFYPRILVADEVMQHLAGFRRDPGSMQTIRDQTGRWVINPFSLPFDGSDPAIGSIVQSHRFPTKAAIDQKIDSLEETDRHSDAEKWRYLSQFITGPVLDAAPNLRRYWHGAG